MGTAPDEVGRASVVGVPLLPGAYVQVDRRGRGLSLSSGGHLGSLVDRLYGPVRGPGPHLVRRSGDTPTPDELGPSFTLPS